MRLHNSLDCLGSAQFFLSQIVPEEQSPLVSHWCSSNPHWPYPPEFNIMSQNNNFQTMCGLKKEMLPDSRPCHPFHPSKELACPIPDNQSY
jgi:hypothetical protein